MNHINILKRAFNITVNYRALWIFGMLLALTAGGGNGGGNGGGSPSTNNNPNFNWPDSFGDFPQQISNMWVGIAIALACLVLILIVAGTIARYVSETAVIRMVDEHENSGEKVTVRQGFRLGWSQAAWIMFLMDLLVGLGFMVIFLLLLALGALPLFVWATKNTPLQVIGTIISSGLILLLVFATIIAALAVSLIMIFARRFCALENLGVRASLRRGFELVKQRLGDLVIMGAIMFGVGLLWAVVTIPIILVILLGAVLIGGLPALLAGSVAGFFAEGATPWVVAGIVGAPIFLIVVIIPGALISGWQKIFSSSAWTLAYREARALEHIKVNDELPVTD